MDLAAIYRQLLSILTEIHQQPIDAVKVALDHPLEAAAGGANQLEET